MKICVLLLVIATVFASGQRITTIQLDGVQYFISRMNPYSPELNYFLAYQYCRSLGLQLASFETKEKADTLTEYLRNAGYTKYDFWTSGNKLGTDMFLWMSSGLPFNVTFDYMLRRTGNRAVDVPPGTEPQRVARESGDSGSADGCVAMVAPTLAWEAQDCTRVKDFICEQTRCYYYNYGSISVSATQGNLRLYLTTTAAPNNDIDEDHVTNKENVNKEGIKEPSEVEADEIKDALNGEGAAEGEVEEAEDDSSSFDEGHSDDNALENNKNEPVEGSTSSFNGENKKLEDPIVGRLMTSAADISGVNSDATVSISSSNRDNSDNEKMENSDETNNGETVRDDASDEDRRISIQVVKSTRPDDIPDITSLFTDGPLVQSRKETAFDGLETHEIRSSSRSNVRGKLEHRQSPDIVDIVTGLVANAENDKIVSDVEDNHTIGPYDSIQEDYVNDQQNDDGNNNDRDKASLDSSLNIGAPIVSGVNNKEQQQDEESSTFLPEAEPEYRYNMKWRSMGKVLDPPSK